MADLTFAQDFGSSVNLDSSLSGTPDSGLFWNRGVHPLVTIDNLLKFLPNIDITFSAYSVTATYSTFATSKSKNDIVTHSGKTYEALLPSSELSPKTPGTDTTYWLETNIQSLRVKSFLWSVDENFKSALQLSKSLIENQYIYNIGKTAQTLSGDFIGWAFEPKNSDYVKIKINQIAFQANTNVAQNLYIINQGILIDTLVLNPKNGILEFEAINYTISGKGAFYFVFANVEVLTEGAYNDSLRYSGFVCYPIVGNGLTAASADYSQTSNGNGLNFNISCYLDSSDYINNNSVHLAKFKQCQFEMDVIQMFLHNSNIQSNTAERVIGSQNLTGLLATETMDLTLNTIARKYTNELKKAKQAIERTFDSFMRISKQLAVKRSVI